MYPRIFSAPGNRSFFLFGPRGTGKSSWVREHLPGALYIDLLESDAYLELLASPQRLSARIPPAFSGWVVIDEVQKVPAVLDEVHRLMERRRLRFALTGSSARKLKRGGVNLLAGRAVTCRMHPLTATELGDDFDVRRSLRYGQMPMVHEHFEPEAARDYLRSYVATFLREEVQQEALTRNIGAFQRFLEAASFAQAGLLNISAVARDAQVERKVVEDYFTILEDLLLAARVPVFTRRAKRISTAHPKFFFFDCGVFRAIRPQGPLDSAEELDGAALETLVFQELRAHNDYRRWNYNLFHWRTQRGHEVDLVLYGERGLHGIEVKRTGRLRPDDFRGLQALAADYPSARPVLVYTGSREYQEGVVRVIPVESFLRRLPLLF